MKITVIGSGSIFFTRQLAKGMIEMPFFHGWELALVDTNAHRCEQMGRFIQKAVAEAGVNLRVTYTTDRREALPGSRYVMLTFADGNAITRAIGAQVCRQHGVLECSGDTAGPGGVFRTVRTIPAILEVARDIEKLCPEAWALNLVNPTNVVATALDRHSKVRWLAFCDAQYTPREHAEPWSIGRKIRRYAGLDVTFNPDTWPRFAFRVGGINHCLWMNQLMFDGEDIWPRFKDGLRRAAETEGTRSDAHAEWQLTEIFDAYPTVIGHTKEYVRYFQGRGRHADRDHTLSVWDLNARVRWTRKVWRHVAACLDGKMPVADIFGELRWDMMNHVVAAMEGDTPAYFPVNVRNEGRITNLPDNVIVELWGRFDKGAVQVPVYGELPRGVLGILQPVVDQQELALEAALTGDFHTLVRAVAADPLVMSLSDAKSIVYDLMATEEAYNGDRFDSYWDTTQYPGRFELPPS